MLVWSNYMCVCVRERERERGAKGSVVCIHGGGGDVNHLLSMATFVLSCIQDELVGGTNLSSVSMESTERRQFVTEIQALSKLVATECMLIVILGINVAPPTPTFSVLHTERSGLG